MPEKFPIGSRVSGKVATGKYPNMTYSDAAMRVVGHDGLKSVIVEFLEDKGIWTKGQVTLRQAKDLALREEVKHIPGEAQDGDGHAIGWMELGDLSVGLTRSQDGTLLVSLDKSPESTTQGPVRVRVIPAANDTSSNILWEGDIE